MSDDTKPQGDHLRVLKEIQAEAKKDIISSAFALIENNIISFAGLKIHHNTLKNVKIFIVIIKINGQEFRIEEPIEIQTKDDDKLIAEIILKKISERLMPTIRIEAQKILRQLN